jgi:hypothetical protein
VATGTAQLFVRYDFSLEAAGEETAGGGAKKVYFQEIPVSAGAT